MRDHQATLPIQHGGNQSAIRARLRLGNRPLLDFSAPLNGLGPPRRRGRRGPPATDSIGRYPEPGSPRLVERLAEFHGVPADRILVGAGTTELISLVGQAVRDALPARPRAAAIPTGRSRTWSSRPTASIAGPRRRTACARKSGTSHTLGWDQDFLPERRTGSSGPATPTTRPAAPGTATGCST